jgi:hypothetical protein
MTSRPTTPVVSPTQDVTAWPDSFQQQFVQLSLAQTGRIRMQDIQGAQYYKTSNQLEGRFDQDLALNILLWAQKDRC